MQALRYLFNELLFADTTIWSVRQLFVDKTIWTLHQKDMERFGVSLDTTTDDPRQAGQVIRDAHNQKLRPASWHDWK